MIEVAVEVVPDHVLAFNLRLTRKRRGDYESTNFAVGRSLQFKLWCLNPACEVGYQTATGERLKTRACRVAAWMSPRRKASRTSSSL